MTDDAGDPSPTTGPDSERKADTGTHAPPGADPEATTCADERATTDTVEEIDAATDDTPEPTDATDPELTHTDADGAAGMVSVGDKPDSERRAVARGEIRLRPATIRAVRNDETAKGDVLATARIGAIRAVKHTWEAIPLCHQIPITGTDVSFDVHDDRIVCTVAVETTGKTGCEMEALQGVTGGLGTLWDMVKAAEKADDGGYPDTSIQHVRVLDKTKRPTDSADDTGRTDTDRLDRSVRPPPDGRPQLLPAGPKRRV